MKISIFTIALLALSFIEVADRQPQTVLAQEDIEPFLQCSGPEIPVGTVRDETDRLSQEVVRLVFQLAQDAKAERKAAKEFMPSSDECKANRCVSSCVVNFTQCVAEPAKGCGGEACDRKAIENRLEDVETAYAQLQATRQALSDLLHKRRPSPFVTTDYCNNEQCRNDYGAAGCQKKCQERTWRDHILFNLEEARRGLQECVTPANFYDTGESDQDVDLTLSCQEARLNGVLSEKQAQCFNNNFFCCTIKATQ
ncbi:MAG: hypothetical protein Q7R48_04120 [bacterium]|nr:hypothetical protein [bacterium]